jgi:hypothetical protein
VGFDSDLHDENIIFHAFNLDDFTYEPKRQEELLSKILLFTLEPR